MQTIDRKVGDFHDLEFVFTKEGLASYGKSFEEIVGAFFAVKKKRAEDADNQYFLKKYIKGSTDPEETGISLLEEELIIRVFVKWGKDEYTSIEPGTYEAGIFLKFEGDPSADENVEQYFTLDLKDGFLQEH